MDAADLEWMKRTKRVKLTLPEKAGHYLPVIFPATPALLVLYSVITSPGIHGRRTASETTLYFLVCVTLTALAFYYFDRKLRFKTITVEHDVDHFQDAIRRTAK